MGKILDAYMAKYGGEEKTAAPADVDAVFASIFGAEKTAEAKDDGEKIAAVYEALGRRLAREAWAAEAPAGEEKVAAEELSKEEIQKVAAELLNEMLSGEEKVAGADEFSQIFGERPVEDEAKTAAQAEVIEAVIKAACTGNEQAVETFGRLYKVASTAAGASLRQRIVAVMKGLAAKTKGGLDAVRGALVSGAKAVGAKAKSVGGKAVGAAKEVGQVAKAFPGQSAALAGGGAALGALGGYALSRKGKKD